MNKQPPDNFVALILTNGRPNKVKTVQTLRRSGYTGPIYLVLDDLDSSRKDYEALYPEQIITFDKQKYALETDCGENSGELRAVVFARNACFDIAKNLGYKYFIQLDDDYSHFCFRFDKSLNYFSAGITIKDLNAIFSAMIKFLSGTNALSLAMAQGGDFIGGVDGGFASSVMLKRKCMNSFLCSTERPFKFLGRINEDTTAYVQLGKLGHLFFTTNQISLGQTTTQKSSGGLSEVYLHEGTYVKSFFTILFNPSSVKIRAMGTNHRRLHHFINWNCTVPKILPESTKKLSSDVHA